MNHWNGYMNWPMKKGWVCEICGDTSGFLEWGMPHALCRCSVCHTEYRMRNKEGQVVDVPICQIKPEYYKAWKELWSKLHKPVEQITDEEWELVLGAKNAVDIL